MGKEEREEEVRLLPAGWLSRRDWTGSILVFIISVGVN